MICFIAFKIIMGGIKMNPYQNKNEYETLDATQSNCHISKCHPKYPLAKDPQMPMRNIHYKDWLAVCNSNSIDYNRIGLSPEAYSITRTATLTGISIVSTILGYFDFGLISGVLGIVGSIADILWKEEDVWESLLRQVEAIIDQRLSTFVINQANAQLVGLQNVLTAYEVAVAEWRRNPSLPNAARVILRFSNADAQFRAAMPSFAINGYEVLLLPVYAQAANLHLLLLRDIIRLAAELGYEEEANLNHEEQLKFIEQYTNHCISTYMTGLNNLRGTTATQWLNFNRYRRELTLTVLDLVALFPTYDFRKYPVSTQMELSRTIYTDPIGYSTNNRFFNWLETSQSGANFTDLESGARRSPSVTTWLERFEIFTAGSISLIFGSWAADVWSGNRNHYSLTGTTGTVAMIRTDGRISGSPIPVNVSNNDIFKIDFRANAAGGTESIPSFGITRAQFYNISRSNPVYDNGPGITHPYHQFQNISLILPGESTEESNVNDYSHRLSDVINFTGGLRQNRGDSSSLLSHAWTHISLNRKNIFSSIKITQIPAVKSQRADGNNVILGPGFTGGDLLRLVHPAEPYLMSAEDAQAFQTSFRVRVRYASQGTSTLRLNGGDDSIGGGVVTLPPTTMSLMNLQYQDFAYGYFPTSIRFTPNALFMYIIPISGGSNVVLDKIELIPVNTFTNQLIEKIKK